MCPVRCFEQNQFCLPDATLSQSLFPNLLSLCFHPGQTMVLFSGVWLDWNSEEEDFHSFLRPRYCRFFFFFLRAQLELKSVISSEMWVMDSRLGAITGSYHHHVVMETNHVNCSEAAVRCVWKWLMIGTHLHYLLMQICGTCLLSLSLQMPVSRSFFMGQISPKHVWISLPDANCIFWFNHAKA